MADKPIYVTQPTLAPLDEYVELLRGVWERGILTHNGPLVQQLEQDISKVLGLERFVAVSNGTIALQMAIKALELKGEIITTPFTWIATVSAIQWEGCTPVFCDIDPGTLNIDPAKIEALITKDTVAIMPVHVFGNPCDVDSIDAIAKEHGLKVIYDAAHAIGSTYKGKSLLEYGDISATSLHATKLLNTAEGGGCVATDPDVDAKLRRIRFFGHNEQKDVVEEGFNGKMTEINAALGLANLKYHEKVLADRKTKWEQYRSSLQAVSSLSFQSVGEGANYSYFPIVFETEAILLDVEQKLNAISIYPRRYFYPAVNTYESVVQKATPCPIGEDVSLRVLCLPLYWNLIDSEIKEITSIINGYCNS